MSSWSYWSSAWPGVTLMIEARINTQGLGDWVQVTVADFY